MFSVINRFDKSAAKLVAQLPASLSPVMNTATIIGLPAVVIVVALVAAGLAWVKHNPRITYAFLATLVALGGNTIIKDIVHRSRPHTLYVEHMRIHSYSFPSGHAFGSTVVYGLLAYLAHKNLPAPWNIVTTIGLVLLIITVGISRVYLGAHFPSDVVMGWLLGALSLFIIIKLIHP
jgi:membrane-associated phospholipid phosphatase